jgi:hypothetical protein
MRYALMLLAALALPAKAEGLNLDRWTREDSYRQAAVTALLVIDLGQTLWLVKNPKNSQVCQPSPGFRQIPCSTTHQPRPEGNKLLGETPSIGRVNNYFAISILGHAAISYFLPRGWREGWQYVWIGIEANQVNYNRTIGIKIDF